MHHTTHRCDKLHAFAIIEDAQILFDKLLDLLHRVHRETVLAQCGNVFQCNWTNTKRFRHSPSLTPDLTGFLKPVRSGNYHAASSCKRGSFSHAA